MKLATYKDGSREGQLLVVSRDLRHAHYATGIAHTLQQVLDDWNFMSPQLQDLYEALNRSGDAGTGRARHAFAFDPRQCMAPLPRAPQRIGSVAFVNHLALLRQAAGGPPAAALDSEPFLYQGSGDDFLGPCDAVPCASEAQGIDFEAELAVVTGDVPQGVSATQALDGIRLLMLANSVSLRQLMPAERDRGSGFVLSKPATAFSPVAVTLDELSFNAGSAWDAGRVQLTLQVSWNGRRVGLCEAGPEMTFHFGELMAQLCRTRRLRAGAVIGSGPVSNQDRSHGCCAIVEKRAIEILQDGKALTEFMKFGDSVRMEMKGRDGQSLFGAIEQDVVPLTR